MAGYVKLHRSIWNDPDFIALSPLAQRLYLLLMSQPDISHVGIVPLMPARWARLSPETNAGQMLDLLDELSATNFVLYDEETGEVLVRSYAVYDEANKLRNGPKSLVNAHGRVYSARLRNVIMGVLSTLDVTVESTVEPTVTATVDLTVSAHKTSNMRHEPAPAKRPHDLRRSTLFAAAEIIIERLPPAREPDNPVGYKIRVADRLAAAHPDVDELLSTHAQEVVVEMIVEREAPVSTVESFYAPRANDHDPNCDFCAGSGLKTIDFDRNICGPCECVAPLATVHPIERTA